MVFSPSGLQPASREDLAGRFLALGRTTGHDSIGAAVRGVPGADEKRRASLRRGIPSQTPDREAEDQRTFSGTGGRGLSRTQKATPSNTEQKAAGGLRKKASGVGKGNAALTKQLLNDINAGGDRDPLQERHHKQFIRDCVECFTFHDVDNDGFVPTEELPWMLRNLGQFWTIEDLKGLDTKLRHQGISQLDVTQFIDLVAEEQDRRKLNVGKLAEAFHVMDRLNKNNVALTDLRHYMKIFGERMSDDDWKTLLKITIDVKEGYKAVAIKQPAFLEMFAKSVEDSI
ncbi:EF hand domain-containing protein [Besnoitia besnoiti]|uniref:Calmodulin n=1 Tax=Besnoitia besnoiti TaxID=94643 RepID=A0A2A9MJF0_BESBE|nr:EF hand domain-containing protein [Besnoitia besnoiti]PFH37314.1 EF hand domain-containing protein [Besnoitia besnoiti]